MVAQLLVAQVAGEVIAAGAAAVKNDVAVRTVMHATTVSIQTDATASGSMIAHLKRIFLRPLVHGLPEYRLHLAHGRRARSAQPPFAIANPRGVTEVDIVALDFTFAQVEVQTEQTVSTSVTSLHPQATPAPQAHACAQKLPRPANQPERGSCTYPVRDLNPCYRRERAAS